MIHNNKLFAKANRWRVIILGRLLMCYVFFACNKKFDEPPVFITPDIKPNLTIMQLRSMHFTGSFEKILDEFVIEAIVIADDRKDNFYKSIIVQDSTGGITIRMDGVGLYNDYPVGRKVFIRLKDLWLGDYANMIQLGAAVDRSDSIYPQLTGIPVPLFEKYIVKGNLNSRILARVLAIDQLTDSVQSCLVTIPGAEFAPADTGRPYADAINKLSVNNIIRSCSGGSALLRTSGFANFASAKTPRGNGTITAVYSVFGKEKQLMIRDTSDIRLDGLRCTGPGSKILFKEDFETAVSGSTINFAGWKNIAEAGGRSYLGKLTSNNRYGEITAFATGEAAVVSWLILPPVNLNNAANEVLSFQTKDGFDNGGVLQVYASTNYDGSNSPWKAKWTLLKATIAKGSVSSVAGSWIASGNLSLSGYTGTVYIAFRYDGADPSRSIDKRTTSFQIDNIRIAGN